MVLVLNVVVVVLFVINVVVVLNTVVVLLLVAVAVDVLNTVVVFLFVLRNVLNVVVNVVVVDF